ncbi:MAG: YciI family protein [Deltaproteobacteria bacterium]|nr:YciI family protein [Deltaproteobacteria bacterium]
MKYVLLIHLDESHQPGPEVMPKYVALADDLKAKGQWGGGARLQHSREAKTLRREHVTDGPFAEAREQLGGFYLVDVATRAEAEAIAARIPAAAWGAVEVRPILEFSPP